MADAGKQRWAHRSPGEDLGRGNASPASGSLTRALWLKGWAAAARWHRFESQGIEHLLAGHSCLIAGYHGRPLAWDLCMLTVEVHRRLGYLPHGIVHSGLGAGPMAHLLQDLGFVTGVGPELVAAIQRGEHILVAPGGTREGCRSQAERYRVDWGHRHGYLKLAWRHRLPIVPVAAVGVDDAYWGLNNGDRWGRHLHLPLKLPFWLGLGPAGLWPLSPSFPVQIRQQIGAPVLLWAEDPPTLTADRQPDRETLQRWHLQMQARVQSMLDNLRNT